MQRKITDISKGFATRDGAGVSLIRVLGRDTTKIFDPILMLDSFDSYNPSDYVAGFPMHPHRGIETISYVFSGGMTHRDSLGNEDTIKSKEVQWMNAGSGIMHEEKIPASQRMLGVQLWLNLPQKDKMSPPDYHSIKDIKEIEVDGGILRLLAGKYENHSGFLSKYLPFDYYDISIEKGKSLDIKTDQNRSVMVFSLLGEFEIGGEKIGEKTAAKLSNGSSVNIKALSDDSHLLFMSSIALNEPVAWAGPIVMNTRDELELAFEELNNGSFIKENLKY